MSDKAEHYQLNGVISEPPEAQRMEVDKATAEVLAIAKRSELPALGAVMAMTMLALES